MLRCFYQLLLLLLLLLLLPLARRLPLCCFQLLIPRLLQCVCQLARAWGEQRVARATIDRLLASPPRYRATVQRWPAESFVSDEPAPRTIHPHPHPRPELAAAEWGGRLLFAGTESDMEQPGVIEYVCTGLTRAGCSARMRLLTSALPLPVFAPCHETRTPGVPLARPTLRWLICRSEGRPDDTVRVKLQY